VKKAFSLIELLIVIVIIGVVYTLAITNLQTITEEKLTPSFLNLKEYLLSFEDESQKIELICFDDCKECSVYRDGEKVKVIDSFFDDSVESYRYDYLQGPRQIQKRVFFNEEGRQEDVCFSFSIDKNSVSDQVLVVYKDKVYDYTPYFQEVLVYDYLEEAVDEKERLREEAMQ
jgi:prepilin-type N-terminal cleavage/methylation domain-containing protein